MLTTKKGHQKTDPVALLEALRRHAKEGHALSAKPVRLPYLDLSRRYLAYLEGSVIEVQPHQPMKRIFHPKVWVLAFEKDDKPTDLPGTLPFPKPDLSPGPGTPVFPLRGNSPRGNAAIARNKPLADLLLALPRLSY